MTSKVEYFLAVREGARRRGDRGVYLSITADLARLGYRDPVPAAETTAVPESAEVTAHAAIATGRGAGGGGRAVIAHIDTLLAQNASATATPAVNRGGRRKLPRCEHEKIVGRCRLCAAATAEAEASEGNL